MFRHVDDGQMDIRTPIHRKRPYENIHIIRLKIGTPISDCNIFILKVNTLSALLLVNQIKHIKKHITV